MAIAVVLVEGASHEWGLFPSSSEKGYFFLLSPPFPTANVCNKREWPTLSPLPEVMHKKRKKRIFFFLHIESCLSHYPPFVNDPLSLFLPNPKQTQTILPCVSSDEKKALFVVVMDLSPLDKTFSLRRRRKKCLLLFWKGMKKSHIIRSAPSFPHKVLHFFSSLFFFFFFPQYETKLIAPSPPPPCAVMYLFFSSPYQQSCLSPGQECNPAAVHQEVILHSPLGELPEKKRKK